MKPYQLNHEDFDVRVVRPGDGHIISEIVKSVIVEPNGETGFLRRPISEEDVEEHIQDENKWNILLCRYKGEPAGSLMLCGVNLLEKGGAEDSLLISRLAVMPDFRGIGVGCALYAGAQIWRHKMKLWDWPLVAYTELEPVCNAKSERFHLNNGFVPGKGYRFEDHPAELHKVWVKK